MKKIIYLIAAAAVVIPSFILAEVHPAAGIAMPVLEIGAGSRGTAMGGAFSSVTDDTGAAYWNPAGLGMLKRTMITASYNSWIVGTSQQRLMAALPLETGAIGADILYMNYGTFETADEQGGALNEKISAYDAALHLGYGLQIGRYYRAGITFKAVYQSLGSASVTGFAGDIGMQYKDGRVSAGAVIKNAGVAGSFSMPFAVTGGASYIFTPAQGQGLLLAGDVSFGASGVPEFSAGTEYAFAGMFALRAGYRFSMAEDNLEGLKGLSAGAGIRLSDFVIDYAFLPYGGLGTSHIVGLSYIFGDNKPQVKNKVQPPKK